MIELTLFQGIKIFLIIKVTKLSRLFTQRVFFISQGFTAAKILVLIRNKYLITLLRLVKQEQNFLHTHKHTHTQTHTHTHTRTHGKQVTQL